jgi:hypothetical protein
LTERVQPAQEKQAEKHWLGGALDYAGALKRNAVLEQQATRPLVDWTYRGDLTDGIVGIATYSTASLVAK